MEYKKEQSRLAMREMKVRLCVEYKMTAEEISNHTGLSLKSINRIFNANDELAGLHTFSLVGRTPIDDKRIQNLKRFL